MKKLFKMVILALIAVLCVVAAVGCAPSNDGGKQGLQIMKYTGDDYYTVYGYVGEESVTTLNLEEEAKKLSEEKGVEVKIGRIKTNSFNGNDTITELIIPQTVEVMDKGALAGMKKLQKLTVPFVGKCFEADSFYAETEKRDKAVDSERTLGYLFGEQAYELGTQIVQHYDAENTIATYLPLSLTEVTVNPKTGYKLPMYAFSGNTRIRKVNLNDKVTVIGQSAFENCTMLSTITIPKTVEIIRDYAFSGCVNIKDATFSFEANSTLKTIGEGSFYGVGLNNLVLPDSVTSIGVRCFKESSLISITLPASITKIPAYAFFNCADLETVNGFDLSKTEDIGAYAFYGCDSLA